MGAGDKITSGPDRHAMFNSLASYGSVDPEQVTFSYKKGDHLLSATGVIGSLKGIGGSWGLFELSLRVGFDEFINFVYNPFGKEELKGYLLDEDK